MKISIMIPVWNSVSVITGWHVQCLCQRYILKSYGPEIRKNLGLRSN